MTNSTPCYLIHMSRRDGQPMDTETGTLIYSHCYFKRTRTGELGKPHTEKAMIRKFNTMMGRKGYFVSAVEVVNIGQK